MKGQRRGGSGKMFSLFLKGMKIKARFVLSPVELIPGRLGSGCQGSELSALFLVCGSYCDLPLDRSVSALELGARVPANASLNLEGSGSIPVWGLRPGKLSSEGIVYVRDCSHRRGPIPADLSHGPPQ